MSKKVVITVPDNWNYKNPVDLLKFNFHKAFIEAFYIRWDFQESDFKKFLDFFLKECYSVYDKSIG